MTPEEETRAKEVYLERLKKRRGEKYVEENSEFLEAEWEWIKELGMIDPKVDR